MRALRFDGREVALDPNAPIPEPAPGEALIRVIKGAIARLDLDAAQPGSGFTGILGHEFVGVVERIGSDDATPAQKKSAARGSPASPGAALVGKRVVGAALVSCGVCDLCTRGLAWHCREGRIAGLKGRDGRFAEKSCAPAANLAPVPEEVEDDAALFTGALAQAIQNAQHAGAGLHARGGRAPGNSGSSGASGAPGVSADRSGFVTVAGDGPIGLLTALVLSRQGHAVRLLGRHEHKMAFCEKQGIKTRHERDAGRRADQDVVVDCTGAADGFALACAMVRPRGRIVLCSRWAAGAALGAGATLGTGGKAPAPDLRALVDHEIELVGSRGGSIGEALSMLRALGPEIGALIGKRFRLDDGAEAFRAAAERGAMRVVLTT